MAMNTNRINIYGSNSGAYPIIPGNLNRTYVTIQNIGSNTIYLGASGTGASGNTFEGTGIPFYAGDTFSTTIYCGSIWGIGSGIIMTNQLTVIEED